MPKLRPVRKDRLDALLFNRGMCESREQGKRLVLAGEVKVDGHVVDKPAEKFGEEAVVEIREKPRFVGRGGLKLEGALRHFAIDVTGARTAGALPLWLREGHSRAARRAAAASTSSSVFVGTSVTRLGRPGA